MDYLEREFNSRAVMDPPTNKQAPKNTRFAQTHLVHEYFVAKSDSSDDDDMLISPADNNLDHLSGKLPLQSTPRGVVDVQNDSELAQMEADLERMDLQMAEIQARGFLNSLSKQPSLQKNAQHRPNHAKETLGGDNHITIAEDKLSQNAYRPSVLLQPSNKKATIDEPIYGVRDNRRRQTLSIDDIIEMIPVMARKSYSKAKEEKSKPRVTATIDEIIDMLQHDDTPNKSRVILQEPHFGECKVAQLSNRAFIERHLARTPDRVETKIKLLAELEEVVDSMKKSLAQEQRECKEQEKINKQIQLEGERLAEKCASLSRDLTLERYQAIMHPIRLLETRYNMRLLKAEETREESSAISFYGECILRDTFFVKIKKDFGKKADIRMSVAVNVELSEQSSLFSTSYCMPILINYFRHSLDRRGSLKEIMIELASYSMRLQLLEKDLELCMSVFPIDNLQVSSTHDNLSFTLQLCSHNFIFTVSLMLLLQEKSYLEVYHVGLKEFVLIPPEEGLLEVLKHLFTRFL